LPLGADHDSATLFAPGVRVVRVGAPGTVAGVTLEDEADHELVPIEFVAATLKMYAVPLVNPVTVSVVAPAASVLDQLVQLVPLLLE
jgi:hypothetical protein